METMGIKATEETLRLSQQYGIFNVVVIIALFFTMGLVVYILRQTREREIEQAKENAKRDERWAILIDKMDNRMDARHEDAQRTMNVLAEADKLQREEHKIMIGLQHESARQKETIARILERISNKLNIQMEGHSL